MIPFLIIILIDVLIINLLYYFVGCAGYVPLVAHTWFLWILSYLIGILTTWPKAHLRNVTADALTGRAFRTALVQMLVFTTYLWIDRFTHLSFLRVFGLSVLLFLSLSVSRYIGHLLLTHLRTIGRNSRSVIFVGAGHNLAYLYQCMINNIGTGYKLIGYFDDHISDNLPRTATRLGNVNEALQWMDQHQRPQMLFCNLPSSRSTEIVELINYCESHFIRFHSVPNVRNYVHRSMEVEMIADMPVLCLRREPLRKSYNRYLKRAFDVVVSGLFLITCFWWIYLIVALITKITMPGPVFFKQKRNGFLGEEFYCLKFRSMKVNNQADKLQATKNDPRKTKWGNIMRHTSIDELPQFINVFLGDMSIVGPRPHMVRHTEEYSALIDKYMVRHFVKPGITGWAQVTGARGETEYLWQMEDRIQKDIWYIENWSLWLDIRIMYMTVRNALFGDKQAY